jgi:putative tryptophan/tyrosine transport system substrate-binding protein
MRRRDVLSLLGGAAIWPRHARAQQNLPKKIGYVNWFPYNAALIEQLRKGLRDLGYVEGRDITIDVHFTDGDLERTRQVVRKLVRDKVDVLVVQATPAIAVAKQEAGSLPIVMSGVSDPIAAGFAQSLSHPGGNLTGRTTIGPIIAGKRIDLIREIRPGLRTVAYLGSSMDANALTFVRATQAETDRTGLRLIVRLIEGPTKIDTAVFEALRREGAEAVIVQPIFTGHQETIVALANEAGLPVIADNAVFAEAGAVFTYGIDTNATAYRAAYFVDRIFKGTKPADLPIEQPTETRFTVNVGALKRFGWTLPPSLLAFADDVID